MSTFRAFQTGLEAGQQQAKVRRQDDARRKATEAYGMGNYEGAVTGLMSEGLTDEASNFNTLGQQAQTRKQQQGYATALGSAPDRRTGMQNLRTSAMQAGDPNTMMAVDEALKGMDADQAAQFGQGMEFLGQTALSLKGVAPEARGQAAIEAIQSSPYANPQILQQIQQAAADGKITDDELDNFAMQTMSVADRVKMQREAMPKPAEPFTLSPGQIRYGADGSELARAPETPKAAGASAPGSLTTNQALNFQFKLDDLDRELTEKERVRKSSLASINENLALVNRFTDDTTPEAKAKFDATYGNMINPTGKKDDAFNWNVALDTNRADGMAILDQLGGSAFLDSIQAMKGSGSLSDAEGARVTAAATRLMTVTMSDTEARIAAKDFKEKLQRYKTALENDIADSRKAEARRRQQLEGMMGRQAPPEAAPAATRTREGVPFLLAKPTNTAAGIPDGVDPEDWKYMSDEQKALFQ
jgi:hypothetical protein